MCDMTHPHVWQVSFICVTWLFHLCDMPHSYAWQNSFICVTRLMHMCDMTHSYVWQTLFMCVTWLIHTSHLSLTYSTYAMCVTSGIPTCCIHICDMTHSYAWRDALGKKITSKIPARCIPVVSSAAFVCLIWLIHVCDMAHSHLWHESFTPVTWLNLRVPYECHVCYLRYTRVLHSHLWHDSFMSVTRHSRKKKVYYYLRNTCTLHSRSEPCGICVCDMTHSCVTWLIHTCQKSVSSKCEN